MAASKLSNANVVTGRGVAFGRHGNSAYSAIVAEIEVNKKTGKIVVKHLYSAMDAGLAVSPALVENQMDGRRDAGASAARSTRRSTFNKTSGHEPRLGHVSDPALQGRAEGDDGRRPAHGLSYRRVAASRRPSAHRGRDRQRVLRRDGRAHPRGADDARARAPRAPGRGHEVETRCGANVQWSRGPERAPGVVSDHLPRAPRRISPSADASETEEVDMSSVQASNEGSAATASTGTVDLKLEVVVIPVADVDRAKAFYAGLGWRLDADFPFDNGFRVVQFTPPGSGCSVQFGTSITAAAPGSAQGLYLIVSDIEAARAELAARGADVSEVFHAGSRAPSSAATAARPRQRARAGATPSYSSFATFRDPDGNGWLLQEITTRLPGRVDAATRRTRRSPSWPTRCGARRPRTASTSSVRAKPTRTGPTGTPSTWSREQAGEELPT